MCRNEIVFLHCLNQVSIRITIEHRQPDDYSVENVRIGMKPVISTYCLLMVLVCSCSEHQYFVKGRSTQPLLDGEYAYMAPLYSENSFNIDSCRVVHGRFEMTGPLDSIQCVMISMGQSCIPVVMETGEVDIHFMSSDIEIGGTPLNDTFYRFLRCRDSLMLARQNIQTEYNAMLRKEVPYDEAERYLTKSLNENSTEMDTLEYMFVRDNYDNVLGITWYLQMGEKASVKTGYYTSTPILDALYNSAPNSFKNNYEIQSFRKQCSSGDNTQKAYIVKFNMF